MREIREFLGLQVQELGKFTAARCIVHRSWTSPHFNPVYWVTERDFRKIVMHFAHLHGKMQTEGAAKRAKLAKRLMGKREKRTRRSPPGQSWFAKRLSGRG